MKNKLNYFIQFLVTKKCLHLIQKFHAYQEDVIQVYTDMDKYWII